MEKMYPKSRYSGSAARSGFSYFVNMDEINDVSPCPGATLLGLKESYVGFPKQVEEMRFLGFQELANEATRILAVKA